MNSQNRKAGFTLIEAIIYIALFSIVIGGGIVTTYALVQSTDNGANHVILQEEANFLLRKVNWALTGATSFTNGSTLSVVKDGTTLIFDLNSGDMRITKSGVTTLLNSSSITVSNLTFSAIGTNGVKTSFRLTTVQNGRNINQDFSTTKYLRQ